MATHKKKWHKTIVLVGLMGAGKSTIGRKLAKSLKLDFCDSDDEIANAAGCSISDIFSVHGEQIFRDLEERVITRILTEEQPKVLATGGGAWMNPHIRSVTKLHAISLWLRADVDVLVERVSRKNTRPLLAQGDKRAILSKMIEDRYPYYQQADYVVDSDAGTHEEIARQIVKLLQQTRDASSHD